MDPPYGEHASNLGVLLARELGDMAGIPAFFVDPVCVDEMTPVAHVSGFRGMQRESFFHALNQKSIARKAAKLLGKSYEEARLIVVHMGGGVSVAAHENGLAVDDFNVKDEGAFGMDRGGGLPVNAVINLCYSGITKKEVKKLLGTEAGAYSYVGTKDFREVERRAFEEKDPDCRLVFDAMAYQLAKDVGAMAAVLKFRVDASCLHRRNGLTPTGSPRPSRIMWAIWPRFCACPARRKCALWRREPCGFSTASRQRYIDFLREIGIVEGGTTCSIPFLRFYRLLRPVRRRGPLPWRRPTTGMFWRR